MSAERKSGEKFDREFTDLHRGLEVATGRASEHHYKTWVASFATSLSLFILQSASPIFFCELGRQYFLNIKYKKRVEKLEDQYQQLLEEQIGELGDQYKQLLDE